MNPAQREAVRDTAAYLRRVRPIDPEEVTQYVEGQPHPAAIRRVLRETAVELELVEREDGTFVPVPDGPVRIEFEGVDRLPDRYDRAVEDLLVADYGADWHRGEPGNRLRTTIRRLKEDYYRNRPVEYDREAALGYAVYHLADYYAAVQYVVSELAAADLLPHRLRVVDVGAGVGGPGLGLIDLLPDDALVEYHAVEPSPAADVLEALLAEVGRNVHPTVHRETAEEASVEGPVDLVLLANVLSELADPAAVVERYADRLAEDGSVVLLAPADRETSIGLRAVERAVVDGLGVFSPTVRLWPGAAPADRCWSFAVRDDLAVPRSQRLLDGAAGATGEFVNVDVQYAYALLRRDDRTRVSFRPDPDRFAPLAESEAHVTERINCAAIKLSADLGERHPLFLIGDGSQRVDHFAVLTRETGLNRPLREADYGDAIAFEGALVLWNDDEGAFNLVVDGETVVDPVG